MVLGGGADHRRAADVDVLDALVEVRAAGDRGLEGVEVHVDEIDTADAVLGHGPGVLRRVTDAEQQKAKLRAISERQSIPMSILLRQWTAQSVEQVERAEREREP